MIKTVVIPKDNNLNLAIPNSYIGKEIEVLAYAKDELNIEKSSPRKSMADFCGVLSDSEYNELKSHTEQARQEWNRDI
jgi:hypothetical protein